MLVPAAVLQELFALWGKFSSLNLPDTNIKHVVFDGLLTKFVEQ
jgi:hypothetical protein